MQPNILFIMADDHAAKAISAYGYGLNQTPHLDRLANEGMRLNHCYVTNSICTPSRASILTGTYNHVNGVTTLATPIDNRLPNVAKHLRQAGYQTAIFGKWHLGEGRAHEPTGFDSWSVVPGQGDYFDPVMIQKGGRETIEHGYATDVITDKCLEWLNARDASRPFFLMCHHKAPHRSFEPHPKYRSLFADDDVKMPDTFDDDYKNRARAAKAAKMRIRSDMTYRDLGLVQPEGGSEVGEPMGPGQHDRKVPDPDDVRDLVLIDQLTGERFRFETKSELAAFKYQRYIKRYLRTVASIDENVGRLLDWLDDAGLAETTMVIYTSDQGFFLGEHGWFDKRFMYEESLQMPFLVRYPEGDRSGIDFGRHRDQCRFRPDLSRLRQRCLRPSYMQGHSLRPVFEGKPGPDWQTSAYHRYWMHKDEFHYAWAHYGLRNQRYKLIYWYNSALGQDGAFEGDEPPEWELFDCEADPLELFNVADDPAYADVFRSMLRELDAKMAEVGDIPEH